MILAGDPLQWWGSHTWAGVGWKSPEGPGVSGRCGDGIDPPAGDQTLQLYIGPADVSYLDPSLGSPTHPVRSYV